jgi:hypothetical protein
MNHREYLTINELSELIGRSPGAIRNLALRRRIPYRKSGGRLLFLADGIQRWIEENERSRLEDMNRED